MTSRSEIFLELISSQRICNVTMYIFGHVMRGIPKEEVFATRLKRCRNTVATSSCLLVRIPFLSLCVYSSSVGKLTFTKSITT